MSTDENTFVYSRTDPGSPTLLTERSRIAHVRKRVIRAIRSAVDDAGAEGVVVAMSGGLDSTTTAMLAVEALGSDRVLGLGLPCYKADQPGVSDARTIADGLGIEFHELQLRPLLETFDGMVTPALEPEAEPERPNERNREFGNATARFRMACAYYAANRQSRLVLGTANRSELLLGYFTKYGDGGADRYPIGDLYKTEVRTLASQTGVPRRIVTKEPTAGFFAGQTDLEEIGASYDVIDPLLGRLVDYEESVAEAAATVGVDLETAESIAGMITETAHKRAIPQTPGIDDRVVPVDPLGDGER